MIKKYIFSILLLATVVSADYSGTWTPVMQQSSLYFSSDRVTMAGVGAGFGVQHAMRQNLFFQADANILWLNGNAVATRFALGYQRPNRWSPAVLATFDLLWGQRTEILSPQGELPPAPVWVAGLRIAPLRFNSPTASVSALELGYGVGPDNGISLQLTVLSVGVRW